MGTQARPQENGAWFVRLMVPGRFTGTAVPGLASREDAQWLADAIEAEIKARGYDL